MRRCFGVCLVGEMGVPLGIRCGGPPGDPVVEDTPLGENRCVGRPMDGAEYRLWSLALKSDGEFFVGRRVTGVAEP
jgi:hypothetical protein